MMEAVENLALKNILLDAAAKEFEEELHEKEPVVVSDRFRRQMLRMLSNPNKWAKERNRGSAWTRCLQSVAVFFLICSVAVGSIMVVSPTARAAIITWVTEWYESSVIYRFFGEPTFTKMPQYEIADLPFGYKETGMPVESPNDVEIFYENSEGEVIRFEYMRVEEGTAVEIETDNMDIIEIKDNDFLGHVYISKDINQSNLITWLDEKEEVQFVIDGFFDSKKLVELAKRVERIG